MKKEGKLLSLSSSSPSLQFRCLSPSSSFSLFSPYRFQEIPVAGHAAAHADVVAEREPAEGRGDADEERVARELADRLFEGAVGGVCVAPRRREDGRRHCFFVMRVVAGCKCTSRRLRARDRESWRAGGTLKKARIDVKAGRFFFFFFSRRIFLKKREINRRFSFFNVILCPRFPRRSPHHHAPLLSFYFSQSAGRVQALHAHGA